jgi:hypothetical protein
MLAWFRYRYQLWRLQLKRRLAVKQVEDFDDIKTIRTLDEAIYILMSDYLIDAAEKLMIEVPHPSPPEWERSNLHSRVYLSQASRHKLRAAIRTERKERSELARSWLSSITGLIGVLIGLLAIILGHR